MFFGCQNMRFTQIFYVHVKVSHNRQNPSQSHWTCGTYCSRQQKIFWIKTHLLFLIWWFNLKHQNFLRFSTFYSHLLYYYYVMDNTAKLILIRNILKHPKKYDFLKQLAYLKEKPFFPPAQNSIFQVLDTPCQQEHS